MYTFAEGEAKIDMNLYQRFNELNIDIRYLDSKSNKQIIKLNMCQNMFAFGLLSVQNVVK